MWAINHSGFITSGLQKAPKTVGGLRNTTLVVLLRMFLIHSLLASARVSLPGLSSPSIAYIKRSEPSGSGIECVKKKKERWGRRHDGMNEREIRNGWTLYILLSIRGLSRRR